jgi:hypothetical protein
MQLNALNLALVLGLLLLLLLILAFVIFKICRQTSNDAVAPRRFDDSCEAGDSSDSSVKTLDIGELGTKRKCLPKPMLILHKF